MACQHYIPYGFNDPIWACGKGRPIPVCGHPGCIREAVLLCDYPTAKGTCDHPMCVEHAKRIGPDRHLCAIHAQEYTGPVDDSEPETFPPEYLCLSRECPARKGCYRLARGIRFKDAYLGSDLLVADFDSMRRPEWRCPHFLPFPR